MPFKDFLKPEDLREESAYQVAKAIKELGGVIHGDDVLLPGQPRIGLRVFAAIMKQGARRGYP